MSATPGPLRRLLGFELRQLLAQRPLLVVVLGLPLIYPLLVSWLYLRETAVERPLVIVDEDNSPHSRELTLALQATQGLRLVERTGSLAEAQGLLQQRRVEVVVQIPTGFERRLRQHEALSLPCWIDGVNLMTYAVSFAALQETVLAFNERRARQFFAGAGVPRPQAELRSRPVLRDVRLLDNPTTRYGGFFVPGILALVLHQLVLLSLSFSAGLRRERSPSAEEAELRARCPRRALFAAGLLLLPVFLLAAAFLVFVLFPVCGWPRRDAGLLFALFALLAVSALPLGLLAAHYTRDRLACFQLLLFGSPPLFLVSGFTWPLDQMPRYLATLAGLLPSTPALQAVRLLTTGAADPGRLAGLALWLLAVGLGWTVVLLVLVRPAARPVPSLADGSVPGGPACADLSTELPTR